MSGGSNNATIAIPGQDWQLIWPYQFDNFQLDIVGFLAVLGEGSILSIGQVSALSRLFYLPRLLPAPQALLRPSRPTDLPATNASVTAVFSGNYKDHLHHVASIILTPKEDNGKEMPAFTVRCVRIDKEDNSSQKPLSFFGRMSQNEYMDKIFRGKPAAKDDEMESDDKTKTGKTTTDPPIPIEPAVKARASGPLTWLTMLGFFLSLSLFIISIALGDGMSLLATVLLSLLSTLIGLGNKWELGFAKRASNAGSNNKKGDVVIRYPNGSYLIVRCEEEVARELFFAPEVINYQVKESTYRLIALVGTLMLMLGVIFLANAKLQLQLCWGGAYIFLNAAHWAAAAVSPRKHWDYSCYKVREEGLASGPRNKNFTEALFKAILFTKSKEWVRIGKPAAPTSKTWDDWLEEAVQQATSCEQNADTLQKPAFETKDGPVWNLPRSWTAKTAWNKIDNDNNLAAEGHHDGKTQQPPQTV